MRKHFFVLLVVLATLGWALSACSSQPSNEEVAVTRPASTATPTLAPTATEEPMAAETPVAVEPTTAPLQAFVAQLQAAVTNQDYAQMQALMSDPIAVGAWRSEWRMYDPPQVIAEFQNASLPMPSGVQFSNLGDDELTALLGQPPATMFGPQVAVAAALHSTNWGQSSEDEAIRFVVEEDGAYAWRAFLYTSGRFADANVGRVSAPVGLIYRAANDGIYQIQADGRHRQLLDEQTANIANLLVSPDGLHAAFLDDERQLVLINTFVGIEQLLAADADLADFLLWGDSDTLLVGVWLEPSEGGGPNNGHIATLDIHSEDLVILDETRLSGRRPALLSDYNRVAYDVFASGPDDYSTGRLYHPDSGSTVFDPAEFTAAGEMIQGPLFNPAWSADGEKIAWIATTGERHAVQVFEFETKTAVQIFDWDPARFGALIPSPIWSPDNRWLALEVWANGVEGSGIWVLAADGSSQTLADPGGQQPHWINDFQLVFNLNGEPRLYDIDSGKQFLMDLPENSWALQVTNPAELMASTDPGQVTDTSVSNVFMLQDVPMYSGPGEDYAEIGVIFDGQTALVTGQSLDGGWWRVICPDDSVGDCWVSADPSFTMPADGSATYPDPTTLTVADTTTSVSPDGVWQAIATQSAPLVVNERDQFYATLTVTDGETTWTPVKEWLGYGLGYVWPAVFQWSADGRSLYYTYLGTPDGCAVFTNGTDLYRLDLSDGTSTEILPPNSTLGLALSPDESAVAFTRYNGQQEVLVVRDAADGQERSVLLGEPDWDAEAGEIFWSADGRVVVLTLVHDPCGLKESSSVIRVNTESMTATTIIERDERRLVIRDWPDSSTPLARLEDRDGNTWLLNVNTGALTAEG